MSTGTVAEYPHPDIMSTLRSHVETTGRILARLKEHMEATESNCQAIRWDIVNWSSVPILSASTMWNSWSMTMCNNLALLKIDDVIRNPPADDTQANTTTQHSRRIHYVQGIILMYTDYRLHHLLETPDGELRHPYEMLNILKKKFSRSTNSADLYSHYLSLVNHQHMDDQKPLHDQALDLFSKFWQSENQIHDSVKAFFTRSKLPRSYHLVINNFLSVTDITEIDELIVRNRALYFEPSVRYLRQDRDDIGRTSTPQTSLTINGRCSHCGRNNHDKSRCWEIHPELKPTRTRRR